MFNKYGTYWIKETASKHEKKGTKEVKKNWVSSCATSSILFSLLHKKIKNGSTSQDFL